MAINRYLYFISIVIIATSCATLTNSTYTDIHIKTNRDSILIKNEYTNEIFLPNTISAPRSNKHLKINVFNDSNSYQLDIAPQLSREYVWGNIFTLGTGYLIDLTSNKRYSYVNKIFIDTANPTIVKKWYPNHHKQTFTYLGVPFSMTSVINQQNGVSNTFYCTGLSPGVEYYYLPNKAIVFQLGYMSSLNNNKYNAINLSLSHFFKYKNAHVGFGLMQSSGVIKNDTIVNQKAIEVKQSIKSLSPIIHFNYQILDYLNIQITNSFGFIQKNSLNQKYLNNFSISLIYKAQGCGCE